MAQEHNEHTIHQERCALLKVFRTVGRDLGCTRGGRKGNARGGGADGMCGVPAGEGGLCLSSMGGFQHHPPQPFHPWQILFLLNPTKRGSSFHSSQWCLSWLGTVSLCLPRQKVRPSPQNSMAGKGKTLSLFAASPPQPCPWIFRPFVGSQKAPFQTLEHKEQQLHTQCLQGLSLPCEGKGCLTQTHSAPGM